jgi:hypothetical protein
MIAILSAKVPGDHIIAFGANLRSQLEHAWNSKPRSKVSERRAG